MTVGGFSLRRAACAAPRRLSIVRQSPAGGKVPGLRNPVGKFTELPVLSVQSCLAAARCLGTAVRSVQRGGPGTLRYHMACCFAGAAVRSAISRAHRSDHASGLPALARVEKPPSYGHLGRPEATVCCSVRSRSTRLRSGGVASQPGAHMVVRAGSCAISASLLPWCHRLPGWRTPESRAAESNGSGCRGGGSRGAGSAGVTGDRPISAGGAVRPGIEGIGDPRSRRVRRASGRRRSGRAPGRAGPGGGESR